jgi:hypothetical protein
MRVILDNGVDHLEMLVASDIEQGFCKEWENTRNGGFEFRLNIIVLENVLECINGLKTEGLQTNSSFASYLILCV